MLMHQIDCSYINETIIKFRYEKTDNCLEDPKKKNY